jgi:hypothetical protein
MGRPPIGGKAMSAAERVRRYRERLRQAQPPKAAPKAKATTPSPPSDELTTLKKRIAELEAEVARLRAPPAEPQKQQQAHGAQTKSAPKQQAIDREAMYARMRADFEADARERAQWGGRPKSRVIDDIGRLLGPARNIRLDDSVRETITNAMLPHVRDQADIEKGIPRRTYRKVLADLHTDRNPAAMTAFIAFKALEVKKKDGKQAWQSIVIADEKVRTMADIRRKDEERRERARAAAAKRKASASRP